MKVMKFLLCGLYVIGLNIRATVNFEIGIVRKGIISLSSPVQLSLKQEPIKVYQDDLTYIEAELIGEKEDAPLIRFLIATKNEAHVFAVRGMPQLAIPTNGIGMASLQCDGKDETFTIVAAVCKANT